jgi:hypothetical protein
VSDTVFVLLCAAAFGGGVALVFLACRLWASAVVVGAGLVVLGVGLMAAAWAGADGTDVPDANPPPPPSFNMFPSTPNNGLKEAAESYALRLAAWEAARLQAARTPPKPPLVPRAAGYVGLVLAAFGAVAFLGHGLRPE